MAHVLNIFHTAIIFPAVTLNTLVFYLLEGSLLLHTAIIVSAVTLNTLAFYLLEGSLLPYARPTLAADLLRVEHRADDMSRGSAAQISQQ